MRILCTESDKSEPNASIFVNKEAKSGKATTEISPEPSIDGVHQFLGIVANVCHPVPEMEDAAPEDCEPPAFHSGILGMFEFGMTISGPSGMSIDAPSEPHATVSILVLSALNGLPPPAIENAKLLSKNPENTSTNIRRQSSRSSPNLTSLTSGRLAPPAGPKSSREMPGIAPSARPPIASIKVSNPPGISKSENASANLMFGNCKPPGDADKSPVVPSVPPSPNCGKFRSGTATAGLKPPCGK